MQQEFDDMNVELENSRSSLSALEKKQKKFDQVRGECSIWQFMGKRSPLTLPSLILAEIWSDGPFVCRMDGLLCTESDESFFSVVFS